MLCKENSFIRKSRPYLPRFDISVVVEGAITSA